MLRRLEKAGLAKSHPQGTPYLPTLWTDPSTKKPINPDFRQHELDCADLFVAYRQFHPKYLTRWDWHWDKDEETAYGVYKKGSTLYDRRMYFNGRWFFWEVDRGTEPMEKLAEKVDKYIEFSNRNPNILFHVLFTLQYKRHGLDIAPGEELAEIANRGNALLEIFEDRRRGHQFLVAHHSEVLSEPLGPVFVSPADPEKPLSILDL